MSYNSSIPNRTDFLAISQKQLLANYLAIFNSFNQNHASLNNPTTSGMHNSLTFRPQNTDPTTVGDQCAIYNKLVSGTPQLFFRSNNNTTPVQLTNSNYGVHANPFYVSTFVAGPFTIYTGFVRQPLNNVVITLTPATTLIFVSTVTIAQFAPIALFPQIMTAINVTGNQFTLNHLGSDADFTPPAVYFLAIGK